MTSFRRWVLATLFICFPWSSALSAGEWIFRLKDAHVHLRQALFDKNPQAAWEQVDRQTRQQAGLLGEQIRRQSAKLPADKQQELRQKLGVAADARFSDWHAADILVAPCFLDAHPELLVGSRDDDKLKDHGTRMAGPTAIVVQKKTPQEKLVVYTFTAENHFGGQAMDYRAQLSLPSLESILGPLPPMETLSADEQAAQAVAVFKEAQRAFLAKEVDALWPLLDCDSQSQASHFADQVQELVRKKQNAAEMADNLHIPVERLASLDGKQVWALAWTLEDLAMLANARDPHFVSPDEFDRQLVPVQAGSHHKYTRHDPPEAAIAFQADGRSWQIPVRVNARDGTPKMKLYLRPPFYHRLRR